MPSLLPWPMPCSAKRWRTEPAQTVGTSNPWWQRTSSLFCLSILFSISLPLSLLPVCKFRFSEVGPCSSLATVVLPLSSATQPCLFLFPTARVAQPMLLPLLLWPIQDPKHKSLQGTWVPSVLKSQGTFLARPHDRPDSWGEQAPLWLNTKGWFFFFSFLSEESWDFTSDGISYHF